MDDFWIVTRQHKHFSSEITISVLLVIHLSSKANSVKITQLWRQHEQTDYERHFFRWGITPFNPVPLSVLEILLTANNSVVLS